MIDQSSPENNSTREKAGWLDLFREGRAPYTVLLNLGISLHAIDIFIITFITIAIATPNQTPFHYLSYFIANNN